MKRTNTLATLACALACALVGALMPSAQAADAPAVVISEGFGFAETDGPALYRAICQGCHMENGQGARGAGAYPALAANSKLASAGYVPYTVVNGRKGMPAVGRMLSDEQVAAVTNYVRSNFGNNYGTAVTAADVKALRPPPGPRP